jgi:glycosyltransferase involved in cell wall biosynthesis
MEELLIITNYYPPEKGAAANRMEQLALKLNQNNYAVFVVCPLGNYPEGKLFQEYKGKFSIKENRKGIAVKRLWIYPSVSKNVLIRVFSVLSFSFGLFFYLLFKKTPRKVLVQSPPLLLSFISVFVLSLKKKKIIVNVSDLWPLAAIELNAMKEDSFSHKLSLFMERYIYKKASVLLGQSNEIIEHIHSIFPEKNCFLYRNFPDQNNSLIEPKEEGQPIKIFYAGLLGIAQGVLELCKKIDWKTHNVEFHIYGDGAEKQEINNLILSGELKNVFFHGIVNREVLHEKIKAYDVALVPLKARIYGSVPSKIFEYSSLGFPILYFGGGEGEKLVAENNLGWVAKVGNYSELNSAITTISKLTKTELFEMKKEVLETSKKAFDLDKQMKFLLREKAF